MTKQKKGKDNPGFTDRTGERHLTNEGYWITIIEYFNYKNCTIKIDDWNNTVLYNIRYDHIEKGSVCNPFHRTIEGVGYYGVGKYKARIGQKTTKEYRTWSNIMQRCYNKTRQEIQPTYKNCIVDEYWHNFQNFAEWFENNYIEGFHLDKDILVKGNKSYSPETCCFVPQEINGLFTKSGNKRGIYPIGVSFHKYHNKFTARLQKKVENKTVNIGLFTTSEEAFQAYKFHKESYIKEVADKYKGQITDRVHRAMYNYKVEITD